jgi:hypothetical protein
VKTNNIFAVALLALMLGPLPAVADSTARKFADSTAQSTADYKAFYKTVDHSITAYQIYLNPFKYVGKHVDLSNCGIARVIGPDSFQVGCSLIVITEFNTARLTGTETVRVLGTVLGNTTVPGYPGLWPRVQGNFILTRNEKNLWKPL